MNVSSERTVLTRLQELGAQIRARRKALGVSATAAAESAGMSRVTLHRIEKGAPTRHKNSILLKLDLHSVQALQALRQG